MSPDLLRIRQDGELHEADTIARLARRLTEDLAPFAGCRVALASARVRDIVATMIACQSIGCELLLLRDSLPDDSSLWAHWDVAARFDDALAIRPLPSARRLDTGFHLVLTTSGTTGQPKAARHSLDRLLGRIRPPKSGATDAVWLLTYHPASFAGMQVLLTALVSGGTLAACTHATVPDLARVALDARPTHISGTPTFWRGFLLALGGRAAELPLKQVTLGGETVDQATLDRISAVYPSAGIAHIYASTEAGALFAVRDGQAGFPAGWLGQVTDGIELRLNGDMLEVRSPRMMQGYLSGGPPSPVGDGEWLSTGDLVEVRADRTLFMGRIDSVINVGGAKVFPEEVEAVLLECAGVAEARVFGKSNPITGQLVVAEVVLSDSSLNVDATRADIQRHARSRLPAFKVPRVLTVKDRIVVSASGKKQRVQ
ncbi:MAG: AMP-binding protein [Methyloversatilis sp.]|nr:AMP-binding protein [Methyloversatilis sp.]